MYEEKIFNFNAYLCGASKQTFKKVSWIMKTQRKYKMGISNHNIIRGSYKRLLKVLLSKII